MLITGTGTDIGKTVVVAALAASARAKSIAIVKPVQTGLAKDAPGDAETAATLAGVRDYYEFLRLPDALAPETCARLRGRDLPPVADHIAAISALTQELVLIEGAGGLLVRLDLAGGTMLDLALALQQPVLVVTSPNLGTLSMTELTVRALQQQSIEVLGLVIGSWPAQPDLAQHCNLRDLPRLTRVPLLGVIPAGAGALDPLSFAVHAPQWLAPELGGTWALNPS